MDDYAFFAQTWQFPPSEVDQMKWSHRKRLKQGYKDHVMTQELNGKK